MLGLLPSSRTSASASLVGFPAHLLPHPLAIQKIVNRHVDEACICAVEATLDGAHEEALPTQPLESRKNLLEKLIHVHARRRQHAVDDTKHETNFSGVCGLARFGRYVDRDQRVTWESGVDLSVGQQEIRTTLFAEAIFSFPLKWGAKTHAAAPIRAMPCNCGQSLESGIDVDQAKNMNRGARRLSVPDGRDLAPARRDAHSPADFDLRERLSFDPNQSRHARSGSKCNHARSTDVSPASARRRPVGPFKSDASRFTVRSQS